MEIGGFAGAAATGNNARRNDQATEEGQTGCADSASLQAASKAACTDKPKVKLYKSARLAESPQPGGTAKMNVHVTIGRHLVGSGTGTGRCGDRRLRRCHAAQLLSCKTALQD